MFDTLPKNSKDIESWEWEQYTPYFENLLERELTPAETETWLNDLTALYRRFYEQYTTLYVRQSQDTASEDIKTAFFGFLENVLQPFQQKSNEIDQKMVKAELDVPNFEVVMRDTIAEIELFREENIPLQTDDQKIGAEYDEITGGQSIEWDGDEKTIIQLRPLLQNTDRTLREKVFRAITDRQLQDREAINDVWSRLVPIRDEMAKNAGFSDYREYQWKSKKRFDYSIDDVIGFHNAIEEVVVPAAQRLREKRKQQMGLDALRPWDLDVDPLGREPLKPYTELDDLHAKMTAIFDRVNPTFGGYYQSMMDNDMLDLENRKGKANGGYCTTYPLQESAFIFMNSVGLHDDVQTLLHEGGHCFHAYEGFKLPYIQQHQAPIEFCEVASMAMELLAAPHFVDTGLYNDSDAARARIEHLEKNINFWPYMSVVSAFQHWAYTNIEAAKDPANCDAYWGELWDRFMPGVDYTGFEDHRVTGWHRKLHIFRVPFYYVEYGIAQLGAVQVYANALEDYDKAVQQYTDALALGNTKTLPELFEAAGAKLSLTSDVLGKAVEVMEKDIERLEALV